MSIKEHPDYREEKIRLEDTISYIKGAIKAAESRRVNHKEEIKQAYVDLDYLDSSQSYASIMLYSTLIAELVENSTLEGIMDVDITATDTFLQASLGENKDNRLKDIVSTIQSEQNAIIRSDISNPLVVQGVAGSGKTTIALHRIAYLIYTYEKSFHPENFMIIAPNRLFLNYISEVLPELGADQVIQTTFTDYIFELIGHKYKLVDSDEKLISIIENQNDNKEEYLALKKK